MSSIDAVAAMNELARLREIEHRVWHLLDDSEQRGDEIAFDRCEDYEVLCSLLPEEHPRALDAAIKAAEWTPHGVKREDVCVWNQDSDGAWNTSCGKIFEFSNEGPKENSANFCYHCGGSLLPEPYSEDESPAQPSPEPARGLTLPFLTDQVTPTFSTGKTVGHGVFNTTHSALLYIPPIRRQVDHQRELFHPRSEAPPLADTQVDVVAGRMEMGGRMTPAEKMAQGLDVAKYDEGTDGRMLGDSAALIRRLAAALADCPEGNDVCGVYAEWRERHVEAFRDAREQA